MIGAGVTSKVVFGYLGNPGIGLGHAFRRAVQAGTLAYEDWTNMAMILRLEAARQGVPFLPSRILQLGDIAGASIDVRTVNCPYTGETRLYPRTQARRCVGPCPAGRQSR